jgi:short-subunit dehydrogenase
MGVGARFNVADLRESRERARVVQDAEEQFGRVDILINGAGVEASSFFHELPHSLMRDILSVNLEAPLVLTQLVLPAMLKRRLGHIVNISSLAGKSGPGFQEPYAATKAALIAFTYSLRGTYAGSGVSASAICPGFVEAGIYSRIKSETGIEAPRLLGAVPPEHVARAVISAIRHDVPEVIVSRWPVRPLLALSALSPSMGEWFTKVIGVHSFFRRVVEFRKSHEHLESPNKAVPADLHPQNSASNISSIVDTNLNARARMSKPQ